MMKRSSPRPCCVCLLVLVLVTFHGQHVCAAYQDRRAADLSDDRQLVIPWRVRSDGSFVSHQIPHHFERTPRRTAPDDKVVHYRVNIDHEEYHIELYPNDRLIGPGAVVEERRGSQDFLNNMRLKRMHDAQCHYRARVRNQTEDSALSTCYGLVGYIKTRNAWYMIQPVAGHDITKKTKQPHVVYKRSPDEFQTERFERDLCNVMDDTSKSNAKHTSNPHKKASARGNNSRSYTVELLVVLDKSLLDYHRDYDVENYVLTLFNMAAGLFHDASLGVQIQLTIVRMIRLEVEETEMRLSINQDADTTLKYFQEWQRTMNPGDDTHPNHHDCAILISKLDICVSRSLCGFTGTSTIAGTCDPLRGAAIVRDAGLPTGYHIAHQIGHTLGMSHDVAQVNGCHGIVYHADGHVETTVMHPGDMYMTKKWSECSRRYLNSYIEQGMAFCLQDEPSDHYFVATEMLPGVMYNGDDQCRLQYRLDARQCDVGLTCEALKCAIPGWGCVFMRKPPAEGTPCGEKRWCYQMKCLMIGERPGVINGGWSNWSPWSKCSRTCNSGVAYSTRKCNRPAPSGGGAYCVGEQKRHKICATTPCKIGEPSFRDVQCAEFNDWVFPEDGKIHRWVAYNLPEDLKASENPCALYCVNEANLVASLRPKVVDGTTCYRGIRDICIGGACREIPCDLDMESNAVEDVCGVCRGNSTSCVLKQGTMSFATDPRLRKVIDVPAGSRNIHVEETKPSKTRIVVRTRSTKTVLIDGTRLGMFHVPGSKAWLGMIRPRQEALNIPGPITEDLVILVLPKENVTIKYWFGVKERTPRKPVFLWNFIDWGKCSATCGPGEQSARPRCVEKIGGLVDNKYCSNISKPDIKVRSCNQAPCIPRWIIGDWQGCVPCTPGCEKTRAVKCVRPVGRGKQEDLEMIEDAHCQGPKPKETEPCEGVRRRRDNGRDNGKRRHVLFDCTCSKTRSRQNHAASIKAGGSAKTRLNDGRDNGKNDDDDNNNNNDDDEAEDDDNDDVDDNDAAKNDDDDDDKDDRHAKHRLSRNPCESSRSINTNDVNALLNLTTNLIPSEDDSIGGDSYEIRRHRSSHVDKKRLVERNDNRPNDRRVKRSEKIRKGELVIDKGDTRNLTLTIILERDEKNAIVNFPSDFQPQPPVNATEFTLAGMNALLYIQRMQEDVPQALRFRAQDAPEETDSNE